MLAMLEHLDKPWVFVRNARLAFIKSTKVKSNALHAKWGNRTSMPKQPAAIATLVGLAAAKEIVQPARLAFIKSTKAKQNASNATWEKHTSMLKPSAVVVTLEHLAAAKVIVKHAQPVITKIPKVNKNAVIPATRQKKYPTTKAPAANCHRGVPAKWANI